MTVSTVTRLYRKAQAAKKRHKWEAHATTLPNYTVRECSRCGAVRLGDRGRWQWRAVGGERWEAKSPVCEVFASATGRVEWDGTIARVTGVRFIMGGEPRKAGK